MFSPSATLFGNPSGSGLELGGFTPLSGKCFARGVHGVARLPANARIVAGHSFFVFYVSPGRLVITRAPPAVIGHGRPQL
jgi:hypothetical protein